MTLFHRRSWLHQACDSLWFIWAATCGTRDVSPLVEAGSLLGRSSFAVESLPSQELPSAESEPPKSMSRKQRRELVKFNFEKMKTAADELAALAQSLQEDLDKSNEYVFSLQIVEKAAKIEKLAKKIKNAAKGY